MLETIISILTRIAIALEIIAAGYAANQTPAPPAKPTAKKPEPAAEEPAAEEEDFVGDTTEEEEEKITQADVIDEVRRAAKVNPEKLKAALKKLGVERATALKEAQFADAMTALKKIK